MKGNAIVGWANVFSFAHADEGLSPCVGTLRFAHPTCEVGS
jgi:hypothetical protein